MNFEALHVVERTFVEHILLRCFFFSHDLTQLSFCFFSTEIQRVGNVRKRVQVSHGEKRYCIRKVCCRSSEIDEVRLNGDTSCHVGAGFRCCDSRKLSPMPHLKVDLAIER